MAAVLLLTTLTGIMAAFSIWLYLDIPVISTYASALLMELCHSLYVHCLNAYQFFKAGLFWLGGALIAAGFVYAAARAAVTIIKTRRALKRLPLKYNGSVVLIDDRSLKTAFTHGFLKPKIYLSLGLVNSLSTTELRGVFLHELHHKTRRDPLRFFLLAFMKDFFFYLPAAAYIEKYLRWSREHEADDAAASHMEEPLSLASALLKVVRSNSSALSLSASITGGGNTGAATVLERIKRLTGGRAARFTPLRLKMAATSLAVAMLLVFSLTLPLTTGPVNLNHCKTGQCSQNQTASGNTCRVHCDIKD